MFKILQLLPDGGPIYLETDVNATIVEPYNTLSAVLFIMMSVYWYGRLKGSFTKFRFLSLSLLLLTIGGVGGLIYHAFRYSSYFLYMDWMPIMILCIMAGMYFMYKVMNNWWYTIGFFLFVFISDRVLWEMIPEHNGHLRANVNYAVLGLTVLIPTYLMLLKIKFQNWHIVAMAIASFCFALFFRVADHWAILPMGTHFLWHTFGAVAGNFMFLFMYRTKILEEE